MFRQFILHDFVVAELKRCEELYVKFLGDIVGIPKGSLLDRNGHTYRAYRENGRQVQTSIEKDKRLIARMKYKHFIKTVIPGLKRRIDACKLFLKNEQLYDPVAVEQMMKAVYQGLDEHDVFLEGDISLERWLNEPYRRNAFPFEEEHFTDGGVQVRSKAEAMIGTQAEHKGMFFRCEPEKELDTDMQLVYPDFEFFLPNTRRRVCLEHFGRIDDPNYAKRTMFKLANYHRAGLYLGINFFITWETKDKPLNTKDINEVLDHILLLDQRSVCK